MIYFFDGEGEGAAPAEPVDAPVEGGDEAAAPAGDAPEAPADETPAA